MKTRPMHARRRRGSSTGTTTGSTESDRDDGGAGDAVVMMKPRRLRRCDADDGRRIDFVCHASRVIDADDARDFGVGFDADAEGKTVGITEAMSAMMMLRLERESCAMCTGGDARGETAPARVDRAKTRAPDAYASDTAMLDHALRAEDSVVEASNAAYEMRVKGRRAMRAVALDVGVQTADALRRDAATLTGGSSARSVGAQADELDDSAREDEADVGGETKGVSALRVATGRRRSDVDGVSALGVVEAVLRERERAEYGLKYRGVRPVVDDDANDEGDDDGENALTRLATLRSEPLVGLNISALQFNPKRKDLLCVAYGEFNFNRATSEEFNRGALAFWSLQSDAPLRIVRLESGVLSIDWSTTHPNLLVVGCYDGEVLVFDLDDSSSIRRRRVHHDPVWAVKWFDHVSTTGGADTGGKMTVDTAPRLCDTFLSASTDGLVTAWELRDDLQSKRAFSLRWSPPGQPSHADASAARDVQTSEELVRRGGITCVDVSKSAACGSNNSKSYLIGTEEGKIYKCSLARSDQWMTAYEPHIAPTYSLKINPHCPNVFATCSADWSVKIFHDEKLSGGGAPSGSALASSIAIDGASSAAAASNLKESLVLPEYVLERGCEPINDLDWCPWRSTELAIVTDDGALEIWDLASSTIVPLYEFRVGGKESIAAVSVAYSRKTPTVVVVGLANGTATVLRTRWRRVTDTVPPAEKQRERIESLCRRRTQHSSSS